MEVMDLSGSAGWYTAHNKNVLKQQYQQSQIGTP